MNCHAPDTGNIELLAKYCNDKQKEKWLKPLLEGNVMSSYSMTEPDIASSDATQIACSIRRQGNEYVINGRKLFGNSLENPEMKTIILMGCSDPTNDSKWNRHSMVLVPANARGLKQIRNLTIMGEDHAPNGHGETIYENVRIPLENMILGEGRAFEIAQGRLGPGRIHHCMRLIGQCERAYELALIRCIDPRKRPRGKLIGEFDSNIEKIAQMRLEIDSAYLVVLNAADTMDTFSNKAGRYAIAQSKILVPVMAAKIIDECIQLFGGAGLTQATPLPSMWTYARYVRLADGPDAAHRHQVGRDELKTAAGFRDRHAKYAEISKDLRRKLGMNHETV
jgi:acyl-CoA dehydrogenase